MNTLLISSFLFHIIIIGTKNYSNVIKIIFLFTSFITPDIFFTLTQAL